MSGLSVSGTGMEMWEALKKLSDFLDDQIKPIAGKYGLTVMQLRVLCAVKSMGAATVGKVAGAVGIAGTNASALCKKLAQMGYLHRRRGGADDRIVELQLTEHGVSVAGEAETVISETCDQTGLSGVWGKMVDGVRRWEQTAGKFVKREEEGV